MSEQTWTRIILAFAAVVAVAGSGSLLLMTIHMALLGEWLAVGIALGVGVIPVHASVEGLADLWAEFKRDGGAS